MKIENYIKEKVHQLYWTENHNCAVTTLKVLSEIFNVELSAQVYSGALGLNGAGNYRAQCGIVEGTLIFIGIIGKQRELSIDQIQKHCYDYAKEFEMRKKSLLCKELRPQGFSKDNPPHLCEKLTVDSLLLSIRFVNQFINKDNGYSNF
ncbi:MAG: GCAxxG family protein [Bacteroidetes bacterium]|nr:GCAxxG family protein [Bacteroidota bacterium]